MENQTDSVLTIDELSVYLKIAKSTLYQEVQKHQIPGRKIGRQWRFLRDAVDEWLRCRNQAGQEALSNDK